MTPQDPKRLNDVVKQFQRKAAQATQELAAKRKEEHDIEAAVLEDKNKAAQLEKELAATRHDMSVKSMQLPRLKEEVRVKDKELHEDMAEMQEASREQQEALRKLNFGPKKF